MVNPFSQTVPYDATGWVKTTQTLIEHDSFNQRVEWQVVRSTTNDQVARDLTAASALGISISDTEWRLRLHLQWPEFNSFRNTGGLFEGSNVFVVALSDTDHTVNMGTGSQKLIGCRVQNFDGNNPTAGIRAGGSPVPPNGFRGLIRGTVRDGGTETFTDVFTPGGQPGSQSTTHLEIVRNSDSLMTITIFTTPAFTTPIESKTLAIPSGITGLKFLKFSNFNTTNPNTALISGRLPFYEFLSGSSFTPIPPFFPSGLAAKIFNDLGDNGPSTGDEVFARIFKDGNDPETWVRIREKNMFGFLERKGLIQRDVDRVTWDITTWSVV